MLGSDLAGGVFDFGGLLDGASSITKSSSEDEILEGLVEMSDVL
jgi:hypothetical protein